MNNNPATPLTSRSSRRPFTRSLARQQSERITSYFGVRKRVSEAGGGPVGIKKRRSAASDDAPFPSPVSVVGSPDRGFEDPASPGIKHWVPPVRFGASSPTPFGIFEDLPTDMINTLVSKLTYLDMGRLSLSSKSWMAKVDGYVESRQFELRFYREVRLFENMCGADFYSANDPFYTLGVMLGKVRSHISTFSSKISYMLSVARRMYKMIGSLKDYGRLIQGFCESREMSLKQYQEVILAGISLDPKLMNGLNEVMNLNSEDNSQHPFSYKAHLKETEMLVRRGLQDLFLSNRGEDPILESNQFWLASLIAMYRNDPTSVQSKLMYLLYAPTTLLNRKQVIHWDVFSELVVNNRDQAVTLLRPLANALRALMLSKKTKADFPWTKNAVFNLMEEITTYPNPWSMNTFVALLIVQPALIPISITARMIRSHQNEAGDMINTMKLLMYRWGIDCVSHLSGVFVSICNILTFSDRGTLYDNIWEWHNKSINEMRQRFDSHQELEDELKSQVSLLPLLTRLVTQ